MREKVMRLVERQMIMKWGPHMRYAHREGDKHNGVFDTNFCPVGQISGTVMKSSVSVNIINGRV
jgi:hypothetical protein